MSPLSIHHHNRWPLQICAQTRYQTLSQRSMVFTFNRILFINVIWSGIGVGALLTMYAPISNWFVYFLKHSFSFRCTYRVHDFNLLYMTKSVSCHVSIFLFLQIMWNLLLKLILFFTCRPCVQCILAKRRFHSLTFIKSSNVQWNAYKIHSFKIHGQT